MGIQLQHLPADVLGMSATARDTLADRPYPKSLPGMLVPAQLDHIPPIGESFDLHARFELQALLEAGIADFRPHVRVHDNLRLLSHPQAAMVIAGQQPAFLGGPLYNIYKVISAIRLAKSLSDAWQVPVLPAFWNHADDHDIAEVHHLWIQTQSLDLRKVGLAGASSGRIPLSKIQFDQELHRLEATAEILRQGLPDYGHRENAIDLFMPRAGESFSNAFTRVLFELFGPHGLIVIEPDWIREPLSRALAEVVVADVGNALGTDAQGLRAVGGQPAIEASEAALVFQLVNGNRRALRLAPDGYRYDAEPGSRTPSELAAEIIQAPLDYSAGALLRPIVQDKALPSVAYVGGWGELAYHAQLPSLRANANARRTAFVPRLSATVLDSAMLKSLDKLKLTARQALAQRGVVALDPGETKPSPVAAQLKAIAKATKHQVLEQAALLSEAERTVGQQFKKVASQVSSTLEKLAERVENSNKNAKGSDKRHARRVQTGLFPRDLPQERVLGALEICAHYGDQWISELIEEVEPLPTEHLLIHLNELDHSNEA